MKLQASDAARLLARWPLSVHTHARTHLHSLRAPPLLLPRPLPSCTLTGAACVPQRGPLSGTASSLEPILPPLALTFLLLAVSSCSFQRLISPEGVPGGQVAVPGGLCFPPILQGDW